MPTAGTGFSMNLDSLKPHENAKKVLVWESLRINFPEPLEVSKSGKKVNEKLFFSIFMKKCLHIRANFSNFLVTKTINRNKF